MIYDQPSRKKFEWIYIRDIVLSNGAGYGATGEEFQAKSSGNQLFPLDERDNPPEGEDGVTGFSDGAEEMDEGFGADAAFHFRMNGQDMDPTVSEIRKDPPFPFLDPRFFKAGKVRWNLEELRSLVDKRFLRPRTTQIVETKVANQGKYAVVDQPSRGAESGGSLSRQSFKSLDTACEPVPDPDLLLLKQFILPAPVIPGMKLHLMPFRDDPPDDTGKGEGDQGRWEECSVEGGPETIEAGGARPDHFLQEAGVFQDLQNGPPRGVRPDAEEKSGLESLLLQQGKKSGDTPLHPLVGIHIDFQPQDPGHASPCPEKSLFRRG